jgi:hypothetical protein
MNVREQATTASSPVISRPVREMGPKRRIGNIEKLKI